MGSRAGYTCRRCGTRFTAKNGGGFFFDLLHCDTCGRPETVSHQQLGDIHLRFVKGLHVPYALARAELDRRIQAEFEGAPITEAEYHAVVEATFEPCVCGGRFRYDAPARCPSCRSTEGDWELDRTISSVHYD